ncbi:MAG: hypothetical protein C3F13_11040 [Anaerolineales bacterium]|nr:DUF1801 domain-containing protein [Anaerolineae bacterium]PWB52670.1 MAG: hypothetical protein C3F13_11040 [Anaerolineales bacterium]
MNQTGATTSKKSSSGFTADEKAAMKARAREQKAQADETQAETDALEAIAALLEPDRSLARRLHELIKANTPELKARTWYGMPAYAKDGNVVCFFQSAQKFKTRYATLGFSDKANFDEGNMWPVAYALHELTPAEEAKISALVRKAVS